MNILELVLRMDLMMHEIEHRQHRALEAVGQLIQRQARRELGSYQPAVGPLPAWDPLASTTLNGVVIGGQWHPGKIALGYASEGDDNPLVRTGRLGQSIEYRVDGTRGVTIGSNLDEMVFAELGTVNEPPRSILERAAIVQSRRAVEIGRRAVLGAVSPYGFLQAPEAD